MNTPKLPAADGYGRRQVLLILSGLLLATFVASLDQTVATAAMYRIRESLNGLTAQAWVTTAFLITSTVAVPLYGKLTDSRGRKPLFLVAIAVSSSARLCAPSPHRCRCWRSSAPSRASVPEASSR